MEKDLFLSKKTKKDLIYEFIKFHQEVKTHEIIAYGLQIKHIRAERDCRDLAQEGKIERIPKEEKEFRFGFMKENVWRIKKS